MCWAVDSLRPCLCRLTDALVKASGSRLSPKTERVEVLPSTLPFFWSYYRGGGILQRPVPLFSFPPKRLLIESNGSLGIICAGL